MADAAGGQATPSFKLVLVGDGGTGKVRTSSARHQRLLWDTAEIYMGTQPPAPVDSFSQLPQLDMRILRSVGLY